MHVLRHRNGLTDLGNRLRAHPLASAVEAGTSAALRGWYAARVLGEHAAAFDDVWTKVDAIPGWLWRANAAALFRVIQEERPSRVVEIGSYLGRSTVFFALAAAAAGSARAGLVTAIDPHNGDTRQLEVLGVERLPTYDLFLHHCQTAGATSLITPLVTTSVDAARAWRGDIDFLFVDGLHTYESVLADGRAWLPHVRPGGVAVFDDYSVFAEVRSAVDELCSERDLRLWGDVFGQAYVGAGDPPRSVRAVLGVARGAALRRAFGRPVSLSP